MHAVNVTAYSSPIWPFAPCAPANIHTAERVPSEPGQVIIIHRDIAMVRPPHTRAHIPRHTSVPALLDVWRKYHRKVLAVLLPPTSYGVRQCRPAIWRIVTTCSPSRDLAGSWIKWVYGFFAAVMRRTEVHTHAHTLSRAASGIHL